MISRRARLAGLAAAHERIVDRLGDTPRERVIVILAESTIACSTRS
jgi:hypothetical protein